MDECTKNLAYRWVSNQKYIQKWARIWDCLKKEGDSKPTGSPEETHFFLSNIGENLVDNLKNGGKRQKEGHIFMFVAWKKMRGGR